MNTINKIEGVYNNLHIILQKLPKFAKYNSMRASDILKDIKMIEEIIIFVNDIIPKERKNPDFMKFVREGRGIYYKYISQRINYCIDTENLYNTSGIPAIQHDSLATTDIPTIENLKKWITIVTRYTVESNPVYMDIFRSFCNNPDCLFIFEENEESERTPKEDECLISIKTRETSVVSVVEKQTYDTIKELVDYQIITPYMGERLIEKYPEKQTQEQIVQLISKNRSLLVDPEFRDFILNNNDIFLNDRILSILELTNPDNSRIMEMLTSNIDPLLMTMLMGKKKDGGMDPMMLMLACKGKIDPFFLMMMSS